MTFKTTKLRDAITFALVIGASSSGVAFAQEATQTQATNLDRIEVTGSRIRQVELETAQPVLTISREDIQNQGFNSVADILQNISAAGSPTFSRTSPLTANQEAGGQYIDLRNLGAQRTLVLINGKRLGISPDGFQDISTIPAVIVERIEVLKDGASSIYGSDAMAGVINIITRKNFEGAEANVYFGQYGEGDGQKSTYDFLVGFSGERGSITLGAEYHNEDGVWARNRYQSRDTYPGFPQYSQTAVGQYGNWRVGGTGPWYVADRGSDAIGPGAWHPQRNPEDTSRASDQMHVLTPIERRSVFVNANYDLTDKVRFTSDIGYTKRDSNRQIAGYPTQSGAAAINAPMAADSYFNPTGGTSPVNWRRRGWEVPRTTDSSQTTWRFTAALEGSFDIGERYFDWDVGYLFNENDLQIINNGNLYIPNIRQAVGPSFLNAQGTVQCGTALNPIALTSCVPWNPFAGYGAGAVENSLADPNVRNFLYKQEHALGNTKTTSYFANLAGSLATLPAGDLGFAVGYEYRKEQGGFTPDSIAQSGNSTNLASGPTFGEYTLDEVYAELNVPLLADVAFAKELSLNVASRYSDFSSFGNTTNNKFGLKWRPIDSLLVRGTWSEGFRAPTIGDLYGGASQTFVTGFRDPCDSVYGNARGSARCLQDVNAGFRQLNQSGDPTTGPAAQSPVPFVGGSNPLLTPEFSESKTIGLVYSPDFVQGLTVAVDWWNIRIDNTIVADTPNEMLEDCYVKLIEARCVAFTRDPVTQIVTDLRFGNRNSGYTETEGFDIDFTYARDTNFGRFDAKWATTYVSKYESKSVNDEDTVPSQNNGFSSDAGSYFRVRSNLNLGWTRNDIAVNWGMRYNSGTKEGCTFDDLCSLPDFQAPDTNGAVTPMNRVGSVTFHDLQFKWSAPWNASISIGANNVFDKSAPVYFSNPASGFAFYGGHDIGRFVYARYQQKF